MKNVYFAVAWLSLVPVLLYRHKRLNDLGRPLLRGIGWNGLILYVFLIAFWPLPIAVIIGIYYFERQGNGERVAQLQHTFDVLSQIRRQMAMAQTWSFSDLEAPKAQHPPGWWLASDGNWYPPEQRPAE